MEEKIQSMIDILANAKVEAIKADKGNISAGARLRKLLPLLLPIIKATKAQSLGK